MEVDSSVLETIKSHVTEWMTAMSADETKTLDTRREEILRIRWDGIAAALASRNVAPSLLSSKKPLWVRPDPETGRPGSVLHEFATKLANDLFESLDVAAATEEAAEAKARAAAFARAASTAPPPLPETVEAVATAGSGDVAVAVAEVTVAEAEATATDEMTVAEEMAEEPVADDQAMVSSFADFYFPFAAASPRVQGTVPLISSSMDFKRTLLESNEWSSFGRKTFLSDVGLECFDSSRDLFLLQVRIDDMLADLKAKEMSWLDRWVTNYASGSGSGSKELVVAESSLKAWTKMCTNARELVDGGETGMSSQLVEYETKRSHAAAVVADLKHQSDASTRACVDVSSVRGFIFPNFSSKKIKISKTKKSKTSVAHGPHGPKRLSAPVEVTESTMEKIVARVKEMEKEAGNVFGVMNSKMVPCGCPKCLKVKSGSVLPTSPSVKHMWIALNVDGTFDAINSGVWDCYTPAHGEYMGPKCLGPSSGSVVKPTGVKYLSKISDVIVRVFGNDGLNSTFPGDDESYPYNFFVHHHHDMFSGDNKVFLLVPQCCESEKMFSTHFPGYSSSWPIYGPSEEDKPGKLFGDTIFCNNGRTKDPQDFCVKMYGKLGWDESTRDTFVSTKTKSTIWSPDWKKARLQDPSKTRSVRMSKRSTTHLDAGPSNDRPSKKAKVQTDSESQSETESDTESE